MTYGTRARPSGEIRSRMYCYCEGTKRKLREWLRIRYGSLENAAREWHRYSYQTWEDVEPPRSFSGYPDSLDWLQFRIDNAYSLFDWRVKLFRKLDPRHRSHRARGRRHPHQPGFRIAQRMAFGSGSRYLGSDLDRCPAGRRALEAVSGSRPGARRSAGQAVLACGSQGGPLWMQPQVIGRPIEDGRIPDAEDVRIWNLVSCAAGAKGLLYCRWRPLLDGPLFGAFGSLRHGWLVHAAIGDGGPRRALGKQPPGDLEIESG